MANALLTLPRVAALLLVPLLSLGGLLAGPVLAKEGKAWKFDNKLLGKPHKVGIKDPDDADKSTDVSGIACDGMDFPSLCIVADDESQGVQVVIVNDGELTAGDYIHLIDNTFNGKPLELDAEGVAYEKGVFYVIGSHGRPRHEKPGDEARNDARTTAARQIFRIELKRNAVDMRTGKINTMPTPQGTDKLARLIRENPNLRNWYDTSLDEKGLTIEGIAAKDDKLFVGMRGPMLTGNKAVVLEIPISTVFDNNPGEVTLHQLGLGSDTGGHPRGVRDIVPHKEGFLILAGPVLDPDEDKAHPYEIKKGDYTIFSWPGKGELKQGKYDLDGYGTKKENKVKPEAILPLGNDELSFQALVLFDGPEEGAPTAVPVVLKP